jgi:hypothetical protein
MYFILILSLILIEVHLTSSQYPTPPGIKIKPDDYGFSLIQYQVLKEINFTYYERNKRGLQEVVVNCDNFGEYTPHTWAWHLIRCERGDDRYLNNTMICYDEGGRTTHTILYAIDYHIYCGIFDPLSGLRFKRDPNNSDYVDVNSCYISINLNCTVFNPNLPDMIGLMMAFLLIFIILIGTCAYCP